MSAAASGDIQPGLAFARLAGATVGGALLLALLGYFPSNNLGGAVAIPAMFAGIGVSLLGTLAGLAPPLLALHREPLKRHNAVLGGMALRLAATGVLAAVVALSGWVAWRPFVLWVALSYLALLAIDVVGLARLMKQTERSA